MEITVEFTEDQAHALIEHLKQSVPLFSTAEENDEYVSTCTDNQLYLYTALNVLVSEYEYQTNVQEP